MKKTGAVRSEKMRASSFRLPPSSFSSMPSSASESPAHLRLKRLALLWAQAHGYPVAAAEVTVPHFGFRLDAAAYRLGRETVPRSDSRSPRRRQISQAAIGLTAIFECKASRTDCRRDCHSATATRDRLAKLAERKARHEEVLRIHYPSIRNGDSLFPEYETLDFERPGYEAYQRTIAEMRRLNARLQRGTKFDQLTTWRAANLHYLVAEEGVLGPGELPIGWGLLLREGERLTLATRPILHEVASAQRLQLLHRIALAATRASNQLQGITFEEVERARWE
jgi:hypothetical protein